MEQFIEHLVEQHWTKYFFENPKHLHMCFCLVSYLLHQVVRQQCLCSCCFSTARNCTIVTLSLVNYRLVLHAAAVSVCRGHNQRMEFLGDSIMQLVATEYLFIHFPDHHEGHLTVSISLVCSSFHPKIGLFYFFYLFFFFFFYSLWCIVSTTAIFNSHFYLFSVWWYIQITMNDDFWPFRIILYECHQYDNIKSAWLKKYPLECLHVSCFPENQAYSCTWNVFVVIYLP